MISFESVISELDGIFSAGQGGEDPAVAFLVISLLILLGLVLFILLIVALRYKYQQHALWRKEMRLIFSMSTSTLIIFIFMTSVLMFRVNHGIRLLSPLSRRNLLLEADHIQSVAQGGTGRDTDNLQCLCWRCNRKKGGMRTNNQVRRMIDYGIEYLKPYDDSY